MKQIHVHAIIIATLVLGGHRAGGATAPNGWFAAGSRPRDYTMSVDRDTAHSGKASAHVKSIAAKPAGFGTLMQTFKADAFRGKRVSMSGYVRSKDLSEWAGLWMRVDGPRSETLAFDNMQKRPIKGTTDWTKYEIVLEVPAHAEQISWGLLVSGPGEAWMDDLKLDVVGNARATTAPKPAKAVPEAPANLDFEQN